MYIKEGGTTQRLKNNKKIECIRIVAIEGNNHKFELWINDDCLSYLSMNEMLSLKDEIQIEIEKSIR